MKKMRYRFFLLISVAIITYVLLFSSFQSSLANKLGLMQIRAGDSAVLGKMADTQLELTYHTIQISSELRYEGFQVIDYDNDGNLEIVIWADYGNASVLILELSDGDYEITQYLDLKRNISKLYMGFIDLDEFADIICNPYPNSAALSIYFQNNQTNSFPDLPNISYTVSSYPIQDLKVENFMQTNQMEILIAYESHFDRLLYNESTREIQPLDSILVNPEGEFLVANKFLMGNFDINPPYQLKKEILLHGITATSNYSYFLVFHQELEQPKLNVTYDVIKLDGSAHYLDFLVANMNGDNLKDVVGVNSSGIAIYYQKTGFPHLFNSKADKFIDLPDLFHIKAGNFNQKSSIADLVVHDNNSLFIFYDGDFQTPPQTITVPFNIKNIQIADLDKNGLDDILVIGFNDTHSYLIVFYQFAQQISGEEDGNFIAGIVVSTALAGVSATTGMFSSGAELSKLVPTSSIPDSTDPIRLGMGADQKGLDIGTKLPGKWYKRQRFKMYASSIGIGTGLSVLFLLLFYPIAMVSSWLVWLGAIIGPIGFFYGTYDFIYEGLYRHKGNLWKAYYKGKKKFFWDIFSWAKPILTVFCIYTTINMFLILTFANWTLTAALLTTFVGGMVALLLFSVYVLKLGRGLTLEPQKKARVED